MYVWEHMCKRGFTYSKGCYLHVNYTYLHAYVSGNQTKVTALGRLNFKLHTSIYLQAEKKNKRIFISQKCCAEEINELIFK